VVANLGASMTYEVGRKLDPKAPLVLDYYTAHHGVRCCAAIMASCTLAAGAAAWWLGPCYVLWPVEALVLAALAMLVVRPDTYRVVERVAAVSVLAHIWSIPLRRVLEGLV